MNTVSPLSVPTRRGLSWILWSAHPKTPQIDGTQEFRLGILRKSSELYGSEYYHCGLDGRKAAYGSRACLVLYSQ